MKLNVNSRDIKLFDEISTKIFTDYMAEILKNNNIEPTSEDSHGDEYINYTIASAVEVAMKSAEYFCAQRRKHGIKTPTKSTKTTIDNLEI